MGWDGSISSPPPSAKPHPIAMEERKAANKVEEVVDTEIVGAAEATEVVDHDVDMAEVEGEVVEAEEASVADQADRIRIIWDDNSHQSTVLSSPTEEVGR